MTMPKRQPNPIEYLIIAAAKKITLMDDSSFNNLPYDVRKSAYVVWHDAFNMLYDMPYWPRQWS